MAANVLIISGYGLNCEEETKFAFESAGAKSNITHINDLIKSPESFKNYQILAIPGGFSYGDDTGSGNALANKIKNNLWQQVQEFAQSKKLVLGICNGCQTLVNLGLVPVNTGQRKVAMLHNSTAQYQCRWVDLKITGNSIWTKNINYLHMPVANGEGNFYMDNATLAELESNNQIAFKYINADGSAANGKFPANPSGSLADIAGVTDSTGHILAMMPHPERAILTSQRDDYANILDTAKREGKTLNKFTGVMQIFKNAVEYFND